MIEEKLDQILLDLDLIKNHLKIIPDKDYEIIDKTSSVSEYEKFQWKAPYQWYSLSL